MIMTFYDRSGDVLLVEQIISRKVLGYGVSTVVGDSVSGLGPRSRPCSNFGARCAR